MLKVFDEVLKVKVQQLENKNQFVITYRKPLHPFNVYSFQSNDSLIAIYDVEEEKLYINWQKWDYSKTTMKHLKIFINDWTSFTYENKHQFARLVATNPKIDTFTE